MRASKDLLVSYNLFDNLPPEFKNLDESGYFVIYYRPDEEKVSLNIFEYDVVQQVNVSLYRGLSAKVNKHKVVSLDIAYFHGHNYETRDGIFYMFLRTYNAEEDVKRFYRDIMDQDRVADINISTNAITEINNADDFMRALSYFAPNRIQQITFVYDMVNGIFKKKLAKSLYGDMIKKVVNLIKFDGGVMNEIGGSLRYMVIGERARLTEAQAGKLRAAKLLMRSMQTAEEIYKTTGWYFSDKDGKWRTNISDEQADISALHLSDYQDRKLYKPAVSSLSNEDLVSLIKNPDRIYAYNYQGKLSELLSHPTLFSYYPRLANMPVLYFVSDDKVQQNIQQTFYFSPNDRGGFIVLDGSNLYGPIISTLLHETQHSIQRIEDFATGGNDFLAQFVASIGGKAIRKVFASINSLERFFRENLLSEESRMELLDLINQERPANNNSRSILSQLKEKVSEKDSYALSFKEINFMLIVYISENRDFSNNSIVIYLNEKLGDFIFDLFDNVTAAYAEAMSVMKKLSNEGYNNTDINRILFSSYENLYGEMESRSVQASRFVTSEYKNYFFMTEWERSPIKQLVVIDGAETIIDTQNIKAAVERNGDDYVMHFSKFASCIPALHELGHIVHDAMNQLGFEDAIKKSYDGYIGKLDTIDEYFVSRFLGYLGKNIDDDKLVNDIKGDFSIASEEGMDKLFDSIFTEPSYDERLDYLLSLLSSINS